MSSAESTVCVPANDNHHHEPIVVFINFDDYDTRNPSDWSRMKKWRITAAACIFTILVSFAASSYNLGFPSMTRDLNCSELQATAGLAVYTLGFAVVPLVSASLSEEFGRQPLYIVCLIGFLLMHLMIALYVSAPHPFRNQTSNFSAQNIQTVIVARFLQGAFGSTGSTMVGGTIADVWSSKKYVSSAAPSAQIDSLRHFSQSRPANGGLCRLCHRCEWHRTYVRRLGRDESEIGLEMDTMDTSYVRPSVSALL